MINEIQEDTEVRQIFKQRGLFIPLQFECRFENLHMDTPEMAKYVLNKMGKWKTKEVLLK